MCGIIGYTGSLPCRDLLIEGLRRLEYRGYDSAGIALAEQDHLAVVRRVGKVQVLADAIASAPSCARTGIAHTRWATHGQPTEANAHPHLDCSGTIAVVHNGIVENHAALRRVLEANGHRFRSETDSEVLAHLVEHFYGDEVPLEQAVAQALREVEGTYGLAVISSREAEKIVAGRRGSPLLVTLGTHEAVVTSDVHAVLRPHQRVVYLRDGEVATITPTTLQVRELDGTEITPAVQELNLEALRAEKGDWPHFMLKEIHEQPQAIANTLRGRLDLEDGMPHLGGLRDVERELRRARRIVLVACGTSWHAALVGKYLIEEFAGIPADVDYASEFRYRNPVLDERTLVVAISQSGETADTIAALREARRKGALVIGICNVAGSTIARETDAGIFTHAGPEIGVASTKAFTCQLTVLTLFALLLGRQRRLSQSLGKRILRELQSLPELVEETLSVVAGVQELVPEFTGVNNCLYLGRGYNYPVALEGALKLKELSYIHAEGYPAAEMKHGPIALIDENMPVVVVAPRDEIREKILSNVQEIRARRGRVFAVGNAADDELAAQSERLLVVPDAPHYLMPVLTVIPLQLLAYYVAVARGKDVDQPRNLAKSVTVE
jgi:glucosamine--fructose-6-phosphate aminotransferase (isomerizing)